MSISLQLRVTPSLEAVQNATQSAKIDQKVKLALRAQVGLVCSESPREVQRFLERLEQTGDIVLDVSPDDEDIPLENEDDMYSAEWDYTDEDADWDGDDSGFSISGADPYWFDDAYVIRIKRLADGRVEFEIPEMGGESYRGASKLGEGVLGELSQRGRAYRAIVDWLVKNDVVRQVNSLGEFMKMHKFISQAEFLVDQLNRTIPASSFSRYLNGARLAWNESCIPLRELFK